MCLDCNNSSWFNLKLPFTTNIPIFSFSWFIIVLSLLQGKVTLLNKSSSYIQKSNVHYKFVFLKKIANWACHEGEIFECVTSLPAGLQLRLFRIFFVFLLYNSFTDLIHEENVIQVFNQVWCYMIKGSV